MMVLCSFIILYHCNDGLLLVYYTISLQWWSSACLLCYITAMMVLCLFIILYHCNDGLMLVYYTISLQWWSYARLLYYITAMMVLCSFIILYHCNDGLMLVYYTISLQWWSYACWFQILFLNKVDLFQDKIRFSGRHLRYFFPDFTGKAWGDRSSLLIGCQENKFVKHTLFISWLFFNFYCHFWLQNVLTSCLLKIVTWQFTMVMGK